MRGHTVSGCRTVRQSSAQTRKNVSWSESWRCSRFSMGSISSCGSSGASSGGDSSEGTGTGVGFHVAADGITLEPSGAIPGAMTRPSSLNAASASAAAATIAFARSSLNCFRSARRFAVISSDVRPMLQESSARYSDGKKGNAHLSPSSFSHLLASPTSSVHSLTSHLFQRIPAAIIW